MAHDDNSRREARRKYVTERQPLPMVALMVKVPESTLRRWKRAAKASGDDWDMARSAGMVAGGGLDALMSEVIEDYVVQHKSAIESLRETTDIDATGKAKVLASLADSFNKTMVSAGRLSPQISQLGVAMDVLRRLGDFIASNHPREVETFLAVLEPFGETLPEIYK